MRAGTYTGHCALCPTIRPTSANPDRVPAHVSRAVWERDGGRCQWRLPSGEICGSTHRVQIDHIVPRAWGGPSTVDNIRHRNGLEPAPVRGKATSWHRFLQAHWETLIAADFFTTEVLSWHGLVTYYTLFAIELRSRAILVCGTGDAG